MKIAFCWKDHKEGTRYRHKEGTRYQAQAKAQAKAQGTRHKMKGISLEALGEKKLGIRKNFTDSIS